MANVKLKSIFTKEDIYTVLQLLKALADGVDENDTNMQAQIDELKTKIDTLKPEPEGYSVDNAGNVTIAGALKANNNGNVEVSKNLNVNGNASVNTLPFRAQDIAIAQLPVKDMSGGSGDTGMTLPAILIHCHSTGSIEGTAVRTSGVYAIVRSAITIDGGSSSDTINIPFMATYVYNDNMQPVTTLDEALSEGHLDTATLLGFDPVTFDTEMKTFHIDGGEITEAHIQNLTAKLQQGSYIDNSVIVGSDGYGNSIGSILDLKSDGKYQHTVTLHGDGFEFCFTAMSQKNMQVTSYLDLRTVFGGRRIALTGFSAALSARPVYIDLNGKTVETDFIRVYNEAGGGFSNKTLSSIGTIIYEDDVSEAK